MDRGKLGNAQFIQLTDLQSSLRNKEEGAEAKLARVATIPATIKRVLNGVGVGVGDVGSTPKKEDAAIFDEVTRSVNAEIEAEQQQKGKPVSTADVQRITDELVTKRVILQQPSFWSGNQASTRRAPLYDLQPGERLILTAKDIPLSERQALTNALRQQGMPVTDQTILKAYNNHLLGLVKRGPQ